MTNGQEDRVKTGVAGLDAMLGGGLMRGDSLLVAGSPGTGKTTLALHFLAAGIAANEPGVLITFEYLPQQIYRDAERRGWPIQRWESEGKIRVICTSPELLLGSKDDSFSLLDDLLRGIGARRVVIDSMTNFELLSEPGEHLRSRTAGLINHLRLANVTPLLTHEVPQIIGPAVTISSYGLEFVVDSIVMLRYVELEGTLEKVINVLKFRGGAHDRSYRLLHLGEKGVTVEAPLSNVENITGGAARRLESDRIKRLV